MTRNERKGDMLIVDDDGAVVLHLSEVLGRAGYAVTGETSPRAALDLLGKKDFDLVVADVEMPELRGPDLLKEILAIKPDQLLIFITAFGSIDLAVRMIKEGACDFIAKPFKIELLMIAVERALRERHMRREIVRLSRYLPDTESRGLIAQSPSMHNVMRLARQAAGNDLTVLVTGESGVGKGALANFIHRHSSRAKGPLVQINCAALPGQLVESELFGVKKGAFTDAREDRAGLFIGAAHGTLVLDEIGEMALESQPKLLHALETSSIRPVGANEEIATDVRIIATTNRPLEEALKQKRFRADLYYRINVIHIEIPPLRERIEDIEALTDMFLHKYIKKLKRPLRGISAKATHLLLAYPWPGNVRELANVIQRAVALTEHDTIVPEDLILGRHDAEKDLLEESLAKNLSLAEMERRYVRRIVAMTGGNKTMAAQILDIDRRTLYRKLEETPPTDDGDVR